MTSPAQEHILLTVLGVKPSPATYALGERSEASTVAPAALYRLLSEADRPGRVLALCTPEAAATSLPELMAALGADCPVDVVDIASSPTDDAVHTCLAQLTRDVPAGADLTVDVTHGFRHLSFVAYAGVLYLTALRGVRLRAVYYGMLNGDEPSPFFDLRPLVALPDWFHALRVLKETGSAQVMADLVTASDGNVAGQVGGALRLVSEAYASALPIELGYLAQRFLVDQVEPLRRVLRAQRLPLAEELMHGLTDVLARQQLTRRLPEREWKARVRLDRAELARQARIIDSYIEREQYPTAFGLLREWLVLWAMWRTGIQHRWLDPWGGRKPAERLLHNLGDRAADGDRLTAEQARLGRMWKRLVALRNPYAHHALDRRVTLSTEHRVRDDAAVVLRDWTIMRTVPEFSLDCLLPTGRLLVSPLGVRPGVLYSALRAVERRQLSRCLVVCSAESEGGARRACEAAGYAGEVTLLRLDDPFGGVDELDRRIRAAKGYLREAGEVLVNVTGGTTLMGVLVERIAHAAYRLERQVHRFALIDRRPPAIQEADPYQAGDVCWLGDPPGEDGHGNDD